MCLNLLIHYRLVTVAVYCFWKLPVVKVGVVSWDIWVCMKWISHWSFDGWLEPATDKCLLSCTDSSASTVLRSVVITFHNIKHVQSSAEKWTLGSFNWSLSSVKSHGSTILKFSHVNAMDHPLLRMLHVYLRHVLVNVIVRWSCYTSLVAGLRLANPMRSDQINSGLNRCENCGLDLWIPQIVKFAWSHKNN